MANRNIFTLFSILLVSFTSWGAKVDTLTTHSPFMQKEIKAVVLTPDAYSKNKDYAVVYLLRGYSGNYANWIKQAPALQEYARQHEMIIVSSDGNFGSWYLDSPIIEESKYETYVAKELVHWIDSKYATQAN